MTCCLPPPRVEVFHEASARGIKKSLVLRRRGGPALVSCFFDAELGRRLRINRHVERGPPSNRPT
jgi:hypothetical protein